MESEISKMRLHESVVEAPDPGLPSAIRLGVGVLRMACAVYLCLSSQGLVDDEDRG